MENAWLVMLYGLGGVFAALLALFITVIILVKLFPYRKKEDNNLD